MESDFRNWTDVDMFYGELGRYGDVIPPRVSGEMAGMERRAGDVAGWCRKYRCQDYGSMEGYETALACPWRVVPL